MVLLHVSRLPEEFILSFPHTESVDVVTRHVSKVHNLRLRLRRLAASMRDIAKYGVMKPEAERGLTEEQLNVHGDKAAPLPPNVDPLGMRCGQPPEAASLVTTLNKTADEADAALATSLAKHRTPLTLEQLETELANCKGALMMSYPQGLPDYEPAEHQMNDSEDLKGHEDSKMMMPADSCVLWFAGKAMQRTEPLSTYTGKNDKVMLKVKIEASQSTGAPQREPPVDEATRLKMMSQWHQKQAADKALAGADEDSYLNSEWANPKGFKQAAYGINNIQFRMGGGGFR